MHSLALNIQINFAIDISYEALEDKLWDLLDNLEKDYKLLRSRAVKGYEKLYEKLNEAKCQLSNFLHERKELNRSGLSKLLKILGRVLGILSTIHAIHTGILLDDALTILEYVLTVMSYLVDCQRLFRRKIRKVKMGFFAQIPQVSNRLTPSTDVSSSALVG